MPSTPSASMRCGVLATANRRRVALLTPASVACADSSTAASNSKTLLYSSSLAGWGLAAFRMAKKGSMSDVFIGAHCGSALRDIEEDQRTVVPQAAASSASAVLADGSDGSEAGVWAAMVRSVWSVCAADVFGVGGLS